jgi:HD-GYP domain-containing protein (c-di-GMP phosphodiesterase class II)
MSTHFDTFLTISGRNAWPFIVTNVILSAVAVCTRAGAIAVAVTKGTASFTAFSDAQEGPLWDAAAMLLEAAPPADDLEAEHARAVSDLSRQIGAELGFGGRALEALALGAFLHDVGKSALPEAVLLKPGPLTPPEWELVKGHPESGERMARAAGCPCGPARVIRHHHERYDGGGYPDGLAGEDIPLAARIVAAADAYEAMVEGRPYREPRPPTEAVGELMGGAESQFDPRVVAALSRVVV